MNQNNSPVEPSKTRIDEKKIIDNGVNKNMMKTKPANLLGQNLKYSPCINRITLNPPVVAKLDKSEYVSDAILSLLPEPEPSKNLPPFNYSPSDSKLKQNYTSKLPDQSFEVTKKPPIGPIQKPQKKEKLLPPIPAIIKENDPQLDVKLSLLQQPERYQSRKHQNIIPPLSFTIQSALSSDANLSLLPEPVQNKDAKSNPKSNQQLYGFNLNEICFLQSSFNKAAGIDEKIDRNEFSLFYAQLHPVSINNPKFYKLADSIFTQVDQENTGYFNFTQFLEAYSKLKKYMNH
jgi:hypothetical protein